MSDGSQKCGSVCILGLPNAGKSTLVNHLVGQKVSIVSKKVQTTRCRVLGIALHNDAQILLIDTPGIFKAQKTFERAMIGAAFEALDNADAVIHLVDASKGDPISKNGDIFAKLPSNRPVFLVLNKVDAVDKEKLLTLSQDLNAHFDYQATFMISALKGQGTDSLLNTLETALPDSPWLFDEDEVTDMPMRLMAAEITREKLFNQLHQELPQASFVETESWDTFDNGSIKIGQLIYVQRDSQKAIVLGKRGARIKAIGQEAREELEALLGTRIHLKIFVKVRDNWGEQPDLLEKMGLSPA